MKIEKWRYLPVEIMTEILTWLPVKSILRFRCVSKKWCILFTNPDFIKMHLNHSIEMNRFSLILTKQESTSYSLDDIYSSTATFPSLDYNICTTTGDVTFDMSVEYHCPFLYWRFIEIFGSCNGLICLISDPEFLCIWNPIAQEYKKLPQIPKVSPQTQNLLPPIAPVATYGFGYYCKTGVYKAVQILTAGCDMFSQVRVCTLGTDSWRVLKDIPYIFYLYGKANGVLLDGILHWLVHPCNGVNKPIRVVLSFNVAEETFVEMQLPIPLCSAPEGEHYFKTNIGLLDGKLCLSWNLGDGNVDVWVMNNYGVIESWTKLFRVSMLKENIEYLRPVQSLKNGDVLLFGQPLMQLTQYDGDLILYNPMSRTARFMDTSGYQILEAVQTYVGSLVSVNSICNAGQEDVEQPSGYQILNPVLIDV